MNIKTSQTLRFLVVGLYLTLCLIPVACNAYRKSNVGTEQPRVIRTQEKIDDIKMKEYEIHINLYQIYLNLGLNAIAFFYILTGGILAYFFGNYETSPTVPFSLFKGTRLNPTGKISILKLSLLLPILLSAVFGWVFIYGAVKWSSIMITIQEIRDYMGFVKAPDIQILYWFLLVFGIKYWVIFILLIILLFKKLNAGSGLTDK